jgi:predicted amidohydrolase YtcJ
VTLGKKMGLLVFGFCLLAAIAASPSVYAAEAADAIYINGNIYTVEAGQPKAPALAVIGQKLVFVGSNEGAKELVGAKTKIVDLKGKTVIPGLIEGHMHYTREGAFLLQVNAFWLPKEEILAKVKAEADRLPPGTWIVGSGWNQEVWPDRQFPSKAELDAVAPNHPVSLTRTDGHALWVNSKALEMAGIDQSTPVPAGGIIEKNANGELTGLLFENAMALVRSKITPLSTERLKEAMLKAQAELFSYGLTSALSAGNLTMNSVEDINIMKSLYQDGQLKIRLYAMINAEHAAPYYKSGPEIALFDNRLTVRAVKFYADGALGSRTALMLDDYSDREDWKGVERTSRDKLLAGFREASKAGFQLANHAIGDAGVRNTIDLFEQIMKEQNISANHRWRIEHFQVTTANDIERMAKLKIIPVMQAVHATSDKNMAENRIGADRIKYAYAWRKVLNAGMTIVNGSDAPIELVNPYHGLYASVTRMDRDGNPPGGWYPEEKMTREEALKSFTIWAAYGQFEENLKGSLKPGKLADFVVIDRDYMTCPASEIKDINALMTVVGGEIVYRSSY